MNKTLKDNLSNILGHLLVPTAQLNTLVYAVIQTCWQITNWQVKSNQVKSQVKSQINDLQVQVKSFESQVKSLGFTVQVTSQVALKHMMIALHI